MEYVQQVTGRVQAAKLGDARVLYDALEAHRRELMGQRGFLSMRISRASEPGGDILVSVETRWRNEGALTAYASGARNAEAILREYVELLVADSISERRMEALDSEAEPQAQAEFNRIFMSAAVPLVIFGIGLGVIYALSRIYLEIGNEAATVVAIIVALGILLIAWYFAANEKAPTWQMAAVGTFAVAALLGGAVAAQVREGPERENGHVVEPTPGPGPGPGELVVEMDDNVFLFNGEENPTIEVGANVPVTIRLVNVGAALHNMQIANPEFTSGICETGGDNPCSDPSQISGGEEGAIEFTLPPGTYDYRCDFHTAEMTGTLQVVEGGPTGGEEPPPGEPGGEQPGGPGGEEPGTPGELTVEMDDNVFVLNGEENPEIRVPADTDVTIQLVNIGDALHNMHIANPDYEATICETGGRDPCSDPEQILGGEEGVIEFNLPAGEYDYRCDFHTVEMAGTLIVE